MTNNFECMQTRITINWTWKRRTRFLLEIIVVSTGWLSFSFSLLLKVRVFKKNYFYLPNLFNRPGINPVDVEIIVKCKCRNSGNEANPFCTDPRSFLAPWATFCMHELRFKFHRGEDMLLRWNQEKQRMTIQQMFKKTTRTNKFYFLSPDKMVRKRQ